MKLLFILAALGIFCGIITNYVRVRFEKNRPLIASSRIIAHLNDLNDRQQRAQAASTCSYLANNITFRREMHETGVFEALAFHASSFDLVKDRSDASTLTGCLLALSRMNLADSEAPTAIIQRHRLVPKALEALRSDLPAWVLSSARLLYSMTRSGSLGPTILQSLHQDPITPTSSRARTNGKESPGLSKLVMMLIGLSSGLIEGGAVGRSVDALVSGARLMTLVLEAPTLSQRRLAFKALEKKEVPSMLVKVISVHKGRNESAEVIGAVSEVLDLMILASLSPPSPSTDEHGSTDNEGHDASSYLEEEPGPSITSSIFKLLGESGTVRDLIQELRPQPRPNSATSVLGLLSRLSFTPAGSEQLISGGMLSMCTQIYFSRGSDIMWRLSCMDMICDLSQSPRHRVNLSNSESVDASKGDHGLSEAAARKRILDIISSEEAQLHVIRALLRMIEIGEKAIPPGLHISPLQALVDVADQLPVARVITSAGVLEAAVELISRDLAAEGLYSKEWAIQTQRAAVTLIAVISTHRALRPNVIENNAIEALCNLMKENVHDGAGIRQQIRVTAAAALYPILGEKADKLLVRRAAGALDALVPMLRSHHEPEVRVARKVLEVMLNDEALSRMFRDAGVNVSQSKAPIEEDEYEE